MPSRAQRRKGKKLSAKYLQLKASFCPPLPKKPTPKGDLQILAQEQTFYKILLEDVHKLVDPHFFNDPKFALTQTILCVLLDEGFSTIGNVTQKTEAELLEVPGIGIARLKKIKESLNRLGLTLKV